MYLFVKPTNNGKVEPFGIKPLENVKPDEAENSKEKDCEQIEMNTAENVKTVEKEQSDDFFERLGVFKKRVIGLSLAMLSGVLYGFYATPVLYTNQQYNKLDSLLLIVDHFFY